MIVKLGSLGKWNDFMEVATDLSCKRQANRTLTCLTCLTCVIERLREKEGGRCD